MKGSWATALFAAAGSLILCAEAGEVRREGNYWVAEQQGAAPARGLRVVHIFAPGLVSIRGSATDTITWTVRARAQAADQRKARAFLSTVQARQRRAADDLVLSLSALAGQPDADIAVVVPSAMPLCAIRTKGGSVQAADLGGSLDVASDAGSLQLDGIRGSLTARTGGGDIRIGRVDGDARCFTGAGLIRVDWIGGIGRLDTAGGEIVVQHVHGPLVAASAGGNIEVQRADSSITARTKGGIIEVGQAVGPVMADTAGGAIQITGSSGTQCQASEGGIHLKNVAGAVQAISGAGDIVAELMAGRRLENSKLSTNSGDVTVVIPASVAVTVVAQSTRKAGTGRIVSDFPEIRVADGGGLTGGLEMAEGALNGGGPLLQVLASGGSVYLKRRR